MIFRNTPQWFIRMDVPLEDAAHGGKTLRETALEAIDATAFYPAAGKPTASAPWSRAAPTG